MAQWDYLVVGSGWFGSTFAWHAKRAGKRVLVVEKRSHLGGNSYTYPLHGIHVHKYGPHIFHTSNKRIWDFVNRFARFNSYTHRVKAVSSGRMYSLPINLATMNQLWGVCTPERARIRLEHAQVPFDKPRNMEEWAKSQVGEELYELLVRGYTTKQWGRSPSLLPASILKRLPIRTTWDDNYYDDTYQGIPVGGYTQIFEGLLVGCDVWLDTDYLTERQELDKLADKVVFTGQLDAFFDYRWGALEYRTLDFRTETLDVPDYQGCSQVNWTGLEVPWTRVVEHRHFDSSTAALNKTVVTWETPLSWRRGDEPYYPIGDAENTAKAMQYKEMAAAQSKVLFGGRLGNYQYLDMHQCVGAAMHLALKEGLPVDDS